MKKAEATLSKGVLPPTDAWTLPVFFAGGPISKSFFYGLPPEERPPVRILRGKRVLLREEYLEWLRSLPVDRSTPKRQLAA